MQLEVNTRLSYINFDLMASFRRLKIKCAFSSSQPFYVYNLLTKVTSSNVPSPLVKIQIIGGEVYLR